MIHFKFKSLTFYPVAIAAVVLLFKTVTAYGEANLNAPPAIDGRYRLVTQIPNCWRSQPLELIIQQSGIYINAFLLSSNANAVQVRTQEKRPSLTGQLQRQQLNLAGTVLRTDICQNLVSTTQIKHRNSDLTTTFVRIYSQVQSDKLTGNIALSNIAPAMEFTAQRVTAANSSPNTK